MIKAKLIAAGFASAALATAAPALAGEVFAGAAAHDIDLGITVCCSEGGADVLVGARTEPFGHVLGAEARGYVQGSVNTSGGLDYATVGVALRWPLSERFYVQPGLGVAVTDGPTEKFQATPDRLYLGSSVLFAPEVSLGWRISERWAAEATYIHLSHAQLAGEQNPGSDQLGARLVYRFGGSAR
jgi:hypothetical protein